MAVTALPTSSGVPQRAMGVSPAAMSWSYFPFRAGHVGDDDAGADFIDVDAVFGEPRGEEWSEHGERGLGDAIISTIDRRGVGADGGDGDDLWPVGTSSTSSLILCDQK